MLALGAVLLLAACGQPTQSADCDQLLGEERYQEVLDSCGSPLQRASAHLGLAGLNIFNIINSTETAGNVVNLLGLTTSNITEKRERLILAVEEVRSPATGAEAFALLMGAYLGLAVTMAEFLDNGSGATALDDNIADSESRAATGLGTVTVTVAFNAVSGATPVYQITSSGTAYNITCGGDASAPICDQTGGTVNVYDKTDGAGQLDTAAPPTVSVDQATVRTNLATADPANLVVLLQSLDYPITVDSTKSARLTNFLSQGDADQEFAIGVIGFLDLLDVATAVLFPSGSGGISGISDQISAVRNKIDNGGDCLSSGDATDVSAAGVMDLWYAIYSAAPGTTANPLPNLTDYTTYNIVNYTSLSGGGVTMYPDSTGTLNINPTGYFFANNLGIKFLYPISLPATSFVLGNTTPHIDNADADFQFKFEDIPNIAPAAATAGDGTITFLEVLCSSSS